MNTFRLKRSFLVTSAKFIYKIIKVDFPPFASVSAIVPKRGKILAIKMSYKKGYSLPGGMLRRNENFKEGICREVLEETGLRVTSLRYFKEFAFDVEYPTVNIVYIAKVIGKIKSSSEGKAEWADPKKILPELVYKDNIAALEDFLIK